MNILWVIGLQRWTGHSVSQTLVLLECVQLNCHLSFIIQSMFTLKFTTSIKEKYLLVVNKTISANIIGIADNLLHLLIPLVQNLTPTFSIWSEFSAQTCFVYMTQSRRIWKPLHVLTSKFCEKCLGISFKLVKQLFFICLRAYTCQKNLIFSCNF